MTSVSTEIAFAVEARRRNIGWPIAVASVVGLAGFLAPFLLAATPRNADGAPHRGDAPLLFSLVTLLSLVAIAVQLNDANGQTEGAAAKTVALLGTLVAANAALRLAPTLLGASPLFFLIIVTGFVFGAAFGFQMGALTLLVSAFLTGGVGPWLPFQMLGAGWVGMIAGWLPRHGSQRRQICMLALFAGIAGFGYGALLNLWSWPFAAPGLQGDVGLYWNPGLTFAETTARYAHYYMVTSVWYDLFRAIANVLLVVALAGPVMRTMERYRSRLTWQPWRPVSS